MAKNTLNKEIISIFSEKLDLKEQTIRDQISRFKIKECPNCTQNATAYILGQVRGVKVWGKLNKEDKESLPQNVSEIVDKYTKNSEESKKIPRKKKIKVGNIIPNYESEFISAANSNSKAYPHIYVIENLLRKIILDRLGNNKNWWKTPPLKKNIIDYASRIKSAESKHAWIKNRGNHPVYYVGLGELKDIICKFWETHFKWIGDMEKFRVWVDELIPIRNMVAHNVKLDREEIHTTEQKSKWIITLINTKIEN